METMLTEGTCPIVEPKYSCQACGKAIGVALGFRIADLCGNCFSAGLVWAAKQALAAEQKQPPLGIGTDLSYLDDYERVEPPHARTHHP